MPADHLESSPHEMGTPARGPGGHPIIIGSAEHLAAAVVNGWIIDARSGGLVRGRLHEDGHIIIIQPSSPIGVYEYIGLMEGDEYLMSRGATAAHRARLEAINADRSSCEGELPTLVPGRIIDARAEPHDKLLIICEQFIINRQSTRKYLEELAALNEPFVDCSGQFLRAEEIEYLEAHPELGGGG